MECGLFLGVNIQNLEVQSRALKSHLFKNYLIEMTTAEGVFIGKKVESRIDKESLWNLEANIQSILHKLIPELKSKEIPLILLPFHE